MANSYTVLGVESRNYVRITIKDSVIVRQLSYRIYKNICIMSKFVIIVKNLSWLQTQWNNSSMLSEKINIFSSEVHIYTLQFVIRKI